MLLRTGTKIGPYEIQSPVGAGGMGEVYRARDPRLNRTVAIKVLPAQLKDDPDLRQRFLREAQAVAALEHPHICVLHDIGQHEGIDFLVMEHLEGETLAQRLEKGRLPLDRVLRYAVQIADALDTAHRRGIIHRDLKPANVMLTQAGIKLLDFGLARLKATGPSARPRPPASQGGDGWGEGEAGAAPTISAPLTGQGVILGTLQYMAPEQLEGKDADARTDIFAFGAVVYEMATGRKAFEGKSQASVIAAILEHDPPPMAGLLPPGTAPPTFDRLTKRCLAKDPDERWQSARDLREALTWIGGTEAQIDVRAPEVARRKSGRRLRVAAAVALLLAAFVAVPFVVGYWRRSLGSVEPIRFAVFPPADTSFVGPAVPQGAFAVSPDGRRLVFVAVDDVGTRRLWVRPLDSLIAHMLAGTEGVTHFFWSPDSGFLGFVAQRPLQRHLKKIPSSGGPVQVLSEVPGAGVFAGGTWNRDGVIVFAPSETSALFRISAAGGDALPLTTLDASRQERAQAWPQFLPDGRHFLYLARAAPEHTGIYVGSLDSVAPKWLLSTPVRSVYAPPGYLLFVRDGVLMAQHFDADRLELNGDPVAVAERVVFQARTGTSPISASETGVLAYRSGEVRTANSQLVWFDRGGRRLGPTGEPSQYQNPRLARDGKRLAVEIHDADTGAGDLWLLDLARRTTSRFTFDGSHNSIPVWSPDGNRLVFGSFREGPRDLYLKLTSGAGPDEPLLKSRTGKQPTDWSSDGRYLVYANEDPKTKQDLWVLPLSGDRKPKPYLETPFNEREGRLSPDGRWMAYASDESGAPEVYVQPFPASRGKWQISIKGGEAPRWRRDGKELLYVASGRTIMSVAVETVPTFRAGVPRALFEAPIRRTAMLDYDVTADGQRFLVSTPAEQATESPIIVIVNWMAALRR